MSTNASEGPKYGTDVPSEPTDEFVRRAFMEGARCLWPDSRDPGWYVTFGRWLAARESAAATRARAEGAAEGYALALSKPEIDKVRAKVLTNAADDWRGFGEGRSVMFNRDGLDLSPQQRVEKWLRDRAASIARSDAAPHTGAQS